MLCTNFFLANIVVGRPQESSLIFVDAVHSVYAMEYLPRLLRCSQQVVNG
ncbi:hypothetical protein HMPREF0653_00623 [Prevotella disiens JCM 6334 = ATCC 29426]|uniref:Uncharacterized protein n=1 Tax=Prevotella disiens JCM 6334 = ATCC 29426 TaxID=1235811 RepID=A0ABP2Y9B7_9BACT|nr:hypothetical protein HMPREF0653_00623 [Prevotella disiens JCM 6334 = ATCC 29426]